jgi:hypothetical protein
MSRYTKLPYYKHVQCHAERFGYLVSDGYAASRQCEDDDVVSIG